MKPYQKYVATIVLLLLAIALAWYSFPSKSVPATITPVSEQGRTGPGDSLGISKTYSEVDDSAENPPPPDEPDEFATVIGKVVRADTDAPITNFRIVRLDRPPEGRAQWRGILGADGPNAGILGKVTIEWKEIDSLEGRFELNDIPGDKPFSLAVKADLFEATHISVPAIAPAASRDNIVISLEPVTGFQGHVRNMSGQPISGVAIRLGETNSGRMIARTDREGYFRAVEVDETDLTIFVHHAEYLPSVLVISLRPRELVDVQILLNSGGNIVGSVRLGKLPMPNAHIALSDPRQIIKAVRTDSQGMYRISGILPGELEMSVRNPENDDDSRRVLTRQVVVEEGLETRADFDFAGSLSSIGGLIIVGDHPAAAGLVRVEHFSDSGDSSTVARVQSDGTYHIESVPNGRIRMKVMAQGADGLQRGRQLEINIADGEEYRQNITFNGNGIIEYTVTNFPPGMNASVMLLAGKATFDVNNRNQRTALQERMVLSTVLTDNGNFSLNDIEPGAYTLIVFPASENPAQVFDKDIKIYPLVVENNIPSTVSIEY